MSLFSPIFCVIRAGIECNKIDNFPDLFVLVSRASSWCSCELHKKKKKLQQHQRETTRCAIGWKHSNDCGILWEELHNQHIRTNLHPIASMRKAREKTQHRRRAQRVCGLMSMVPKVLMFRYISLIFYGERVEKYPMVTLPRSMKCFLGGRD